MSRDFKQRLEEKHIREMDASLAKVRAFVAEIERQHGLVEAHPWAKELRALLDAVKNNDAESLRKAFEFIVVALESYEMGQIGPPEHCDGLDA
jgi:SPX domain protein involved in polyphosphate accumulation